MRGIVDDVPGDVGAFRITPAHAGNREAPSWEYDGQ